MADLPELPRTADDSNSEPRPLSRWSVASLLMLALALAGLLLMYGLRTDGYVPGVANRITILLELGACIVVAWVSSLVGAITGWVGARRSSNLAGLAWASVVVNTVLCFGGVPLWAVLLFRMGFFDGL
jgi:hypothetical protein